MLFKYGDITLLKVDDFKPFCYIRHNFFNPGYVIKDDQFESFLMSDFEKYVKVLPYVHLVISL